MNEQAPSNPPSQPSQTPNYPWRVPDWHSDLAPATLEALKKFFDFLIVINRSVSIVSVKTLPFADALHFSDSILACRMIQKDNPSTQDLYDLGSGNGFPGIVYAILFPQTKVHLVESDARKCEALREIVKTLDLKNVDVVNKLVESLPPESVHFAITRGLASISKVILPMRKACPQGARLYHLKGEEWSMEVAQIPTQLCALWTPALVGNYKLPVGELQMSIVRTDRLSLR